MLSFKITLSEKHGLAPYADFMVAFFAYFPTGFCVLESYPVATYTCIIEDYRCLNLRLMRKSLFFSCIIQ